VPLATLMQIWEKATTYLNSSTDVVSAPGPFSLAMEIVVFVLPYSGLNGDLESFLAWYVSTNQGTNLTALASHGLPSGRGRKGGIPVRSRSNRYNSRDLTSTHVLRPAVAPLKNKPSGGLSHPSASHSFDSTAVWGIVQAHQPA